MTMIDNRYKIIKKLGAGAMGIVYKVIDLRNKRVLALKLLSAEKASSEAVQHFKREFRLLATLHHPSLCAVYDFGTRNDGRSYFTMEYIEGKDIFRAVRGLSYDKIYPWIVQLCRVLEYIHAKGLIHYDVKPSNILIQMDGDIENATVKLMDFGLAGEQRIKGGALIKGTLPYIAPEIIKGLAIDHRVDLYSLGVLLYEIFTRRSFQLTKQLSFLTLMKQSTDWQSNPVAEVVPGFPKRLTQLIFRLIAVEPAERYSRANEVIQAINKITSMKFELETEKTVEGYLLSSRFVGRDREMAILQSLYEQARQGNGSVVLATGDAGIGKSRLIKEFKLFTQLARGHCFTGYAHRDKTGLLEPFYDIFKELINHLKGMVLSSEIKFSLTVLFKIFPGLADGYLRRGLPRLVPLEPQQEKLRIFEALTALTRYCSHELNGLVILLEDLHWADDLSIQFLEYLGRNLVDDSILVCVTSRSDELEKNPTIKRVIKNLQNDGYITQIKLKPLNFKYLYSFLDSTITPASNSFELARYLKERTQGNPYFVEEILRTLLRKEGISIGEKIEVKNLKQLTIPKTVEHVILKRISDLDQDAQEVVKFAALLLKDFDYDFMKQLTGFTDPLLSAVFWELKRRQILVEENNAYRFYHAALREVVDKQLGDQEKDALNYRVGRVLEVVNQGRIGRVVEDLAYYFINAKDYKKGMKYGLRAAKKSKTRYAYNQALRFLNGILNLLPNKERGLRFDILQQLAQIEQFVCNYDDAMRHYKEALSMKTGTINEKIKIYFGIGIVCENKGEYNKALQFYRKSLGLLQKMKSGSLKTILETNIKARLCRAHLILRDYKSACRFNFDAIRLPRIVGGKEATRLLGNIYQSMGVIELYRGEYSKTTNYDKVISYYKEAYKYYKKIDDEDRIAAILTDLGVTNYRKFKLLKALNYYQKAIQISKKIGNQSGVLKGLYNVSDILKTRGHFSEATNNIQKALFISKKLGDTTMTGFLSLLLGSCLLYLCDYGNSKKSFERALKIFDIGDLEPYKVYPIWAIGRFYYATGDYTLALRCYNKALRIFRNMGNQFYMAGLFSDIGSTLIEIGEFSGAEKYVNEALKFAKMVGLKDAEIEYYIALCRINLMRETYAIAHDYYEKGVMMAKEFRLKQELLQFLLLASAIYYYEKKYLKGFKIANIAIRIAKEIHTRDLYVEALLIKAKNGVGQDILSAREVFAILDETKNIAEEIGTSELLWKVYFEYGRFHQGNKKYVKALEYYQKCNEIFKNIGDMIKNESYRQSYLNRPDRQAVFYAIDEIEQLLHQ